MKQYPPYQIGELRPHEGFHFDEGVEGVLARIWGKDGFIGIENAVVNPAPADASEEESLKKGVLLLGQGCELFDDKLPDGKRIPDSCCALRMADYLGIREFKWLDKLFNAVKRVDESATASSSDLSKMAKDAVDSMPDEDHPKVFEWLEKGIRAIIEHLYLCHQKETDGIEIDYAGWVRPSAVLETMVDRHVTKNDRIIERMRRLVAGSEAQLHNCIELAAVCQAMKACRVPGDEVVAWVRTGLGYIIQQQEKFKEACSEIRDKGYVFTIRPRFDGDRMTLLYIESDNPQIARASRARGFGHSVCIVKRKISGMAIIPNGLDELDMKVIRANVRMEETPPELRPLADFERYSAAGNLDEVPHWHAMESGALLNGTKHIKAKVITNLSPEQAIWIVQVGFVPRGLERFATLRGSTGAFSASEAAYSAKMGEINREIEARRKAPRAKPEPEARPKNIVQLNNDQPAPGRKDTLSINGAAFPLDEKSQQALEMALDRLVT